VVIRRSIVVAVALVLLLGSAFAHAADETHARSAGGTETFSWYMVSTVTMELNLGELVFFGEAVGDIDGDGHLDVVFPLMHYNWADYDENQEAPPPKVGTVTVAYGDGTGLFEDTAHVYVGNPVMEVELVDMDGDGDLDIVFAGSETEEDGTYTELAFTVPYQGDRTFGEETSIYLPDFYMAIDVEDVNQDGQLDILATYLDREGGFAVVPLYGTGTIDYDVGPYSVSEFPLTATALTVTAEDIDRDGWVDLVAIGRMDLNGDDMTSAVPTLLVGYGRADGTFEFVSTFRYRDYMPMDLEVADLTGDGLPDLAIASPWDVAEGVQRLAQGGDGSLEDNRTIRLLINDGARGWIEDEIPCGHPPRQLVAVDLAGDGYNDLIALPSGTRAAVIHNTEEGFQEPIAYVTRVMSGRRILFGTAADFNEDGESDLCALGTSGQLCVSFGDSTGGLGSGWFSAPVKTPSPFGGAVAQQTADLDGDGHLDIVFRDYYETRVGVAYGDGTGRFHIEELPLDLPYIWPNGSIEQMVVADFNGDGEQDLLIGQEKALDGQLFLFLGQDGTFATTAIQQIDMDFSRQDGIVIGDLNADGQCDAIIVPNIILPTVLLGQPGEKGFLVGQQLTVDEDGRSSASDVHVADFNSDGHLDILGLIDIWQDGTRLMGIGLWAGDGSGGFASGQERAYPGTIEHVADHNGDGYLDFSSSREGDGEGVLYLGDGTGEFTAHPVPSSAFASESRGDLNLDGFTDTVVDFYGEVSIWLRDADAYDSTWYDSFVALWGERAKGELGPAGDFNEDGWPDLIVVGETEIVVLLNRFLERP